MISKDQKIYNNTMVVVRGDVLRPPHRHLHHFQKVIWTTFSIFPDDRQVLLNRSSLDSLKYEEKTGVTCYIRKITDLEYTHCFSHILKFGHPQPGPPYFRFHTGSKTGTHPCANLIERLHGHPTLTFSTKKCCFPVTKVPFERKRIRIIYFRSTFDYTTETLPANWCT